jgi:Fe-S oxidoreductase
MAFAAAIFIAGYRFYRILTPVLKAPSDDRFDQLGTRLKGLFVEVGLHKRLLKIRYSGVLHAMIFVSFIVLFSAILQSFGSGLFPGFSLVPIGGATWIALLQELFAIVLTVAIFLAVYQRLALKPKRFAGSNFTDAFLIYGLVLAVVLGMVMESAFGLAASETTSSWRPLSSAIASRLIAAGFGGERAVGGADFSYWLHIAAVLGFLIYIPGSKHRHMLTAGPNIFFRNLKGKGILPAVPTDGGKAGLAEIDDFHWKHKLDLLSCTECGRCQQVCPAYSAGLPLSPKLLIMSLRDHMLDRTTGDADQTPLIGGVISEQTLWSCTTCRACMDACPIHIEQMPKIVEMRRSLIETGEVEPMLHTALANLQQYGNSHGKPARQRARWTKDLAFKIKDAREQPVDILWFVGDYASYDPRVQRITRRVAQVMHDAGVDFGILYDAERNSGNDVRRVGEEGAFELLARHNIDAVSNCQFNRIMTTDPHSLNALRQEYRLFGFDHEVIHYTQLILELMQTGRVTPARNKGGTVTYHDPCYLGRYNGGFDAPREIMRIAGYALHEMGRCRENSFCCGAGGGRIWMDDSAMTERPSENRIKEALALGDVSAFVVACPKDTVMYTAAAQALGVTENLAVIDIIDLCAPS